MTRNLSPLPKPRISGRDPRPCESARSRRRRHHVVGRSSPHHRGTANNRCRWVSTPRSEVLIAVENARPSHLDHHKRGVTSIHVLALWLQ
jgi:hypothetical protein